MWSISPINLLEAFMHVAPNIVTIQSSRQYFFTLLGATCANAAQKMLMKLTHGVKNSQTLLCYLLSPKTFSLLHSMQLS